MARYDSEQWNPIETAPTDGSNVRAAHFSNRFYCDWECTAAFGLSTVGTKKHWLEVGSAQGEVFLYPSHWLPLESE